MPGWSTHLEAGNRLADKLNIKGKKRQEFLFWCILPDVNNGYINHSHVVKTHEETHYVHEGDGPTNFYNENKTKIDERDLVYLGYFFHLLTDHMFNEDFNNRVKNSQFKDGTEEELEDLKHNDFWLYGTNFRHILDFSREEAEELARQANQIKVVDINADDILEVTKIIKLDEINDHIRNNNYILYTKEDLDNLLNQILEKI